MKLLPEFSEQADVPAALVAERELAPDAHAAKTAEVSRQGANELFSRLPAECFVEVNQPGGIRAEGLDGAQLLRQRIDQRRDSRRGHDDVGMPVKGHRHRERLVLLGVRHRLSDDLLVPQVHAVEHADGHADSAAGGGEIGGVVEDSHRGELEFLRSEW